MDIFHIYPTLAEANKNINKHGIYFSDASTVFNDPFALSREDPDATGEQRLVAIGMDILGRVLIVVYTYRYDDIRLISARLATKA
jgi:hypothetical protein